MTLKKLTYAARDDVSVAVALDGARHVIYCSGEGVARELVRELCAGLAALDHLEPCQEAELPFNVSGYESMSGVMDSPSEVSVRCLADRPGGGDVKTPGEANSVGPLCAIALTDLPNAEDRSDAQRIALEMAALVDTGNTDRDLLSAIERLDRYAEALGRNGEAGAPLAALQARQKALEDEWLQAEQAREAADGFTEDIRLARTHVEASRGRRECLRALLRAAVVVSARDCRRRLNNVLQQIAALEATPHLNTQDVAAVKRKETLVETAVLQCERTREEIAETRAALENALEDLSHSDGDAPVRSEVPDELLQGIRSSLKFITDKSPRLDELNRQMEDLSRQISQAEETQAGLPDFGYLQYDPVDWLNQLSNSLKSAISARYEDEKKRDEVRQQVGDLRIAAAADAHLFADVDSFAKAIEEHESSKKTAEEKIGLLEERIHLNRAQRDDLRESVPGLVALGFGCSLFLIFILGVFFTHGKEPLLYAAAILGVAVLYFVFQLVRTHRQVEHLTQQIAENHAELELLTEAHKGNKSLVEHLMTRAGCITARELEARYDAHCETMKRLRATEARLKQLEQDLHESEERIPQFFKRVCNDLEQVDEQPESPDDVERCVGSAIGKFRVYKEMTHRLNDMRNRQQGLISRRRYLEKELALESDRLQKMESALRDIMRGNGFADESDYTDINILLTDYYRYLELAKETMSRRELMSRRLRALENRFNEEETLAQRYSGELREMLGAFGFSDMDQMQRAADNAGQLADYERERTSLEQELEHLLQGYPLERLEEEVPQSVSPEEAARVSVDETRRELERMDGDCEKACRAYEAARGEQRRHLSGHRSLNEIEEDMAVVERALREARRSLSVAARAMAMMEETAALWRPRHGAALADTARQLLQDMGRQGALTLNLNPGDPDFGISLGPEEGDAVSRAVLHLACRLAAVMVLQSDENPAPLLVDAVALAQPLPVAVETLLAMLERVASRRQVLIISDDAALAAAAVDAGWPALAL